MKVNIVSDLAGRYNEFMLLLEKMPKADMIISLGDLCDRGPDSRKVIEYFMNTPNTEVIKGNHDQLLVDSCRGSFDAQEIWLYNGGTSTIDSYGGAIELIPKEHVDWLDNRPLYIDFPDLFLSHAPVQNLKNLPLKFSRQKNDIGHYGSTFIWNRYAPKRPQEKFVIHGHNSSYREYKFGDGKIFGICLDNCSENELRGIHWNGVNDYKIYTQEYLEIT